MLVHRSISFVDSYRSKICCMQIDELLFGLCLLVTAANGKEGGKNEMNEKNVVNQIKPNQNPSEM